MESYLMITQINDFIFCPRSIYYHNIFTENFVQEVYREKPQITGTLVHETINRKTYTSAKSVLQNQPVYCEKYNLTGRIDLFDIQTGILTERKNSVTAVYDGFKYQLYAQMFALEEMGYHVTSLKLYSYKDNKNYYIPLPDPDETAKFESAIARIRSYDPLHDFSVPNPAKCRACNYRNLCEYNNGDEL